MTPDRAGQALGEARRRSWKAELGRRLAVSRASAGRSNAERQDAKQAPQAQPAVAPSRHTACQWPVWPSGASVPHPAPFCCAPVAAGSYCAAHHAVAYVHVTAVTRYPEDMPPLRTRPWPPAR